MHPQQEKEIVSTFRGSSVVSPVFLEVIPLLLSIEQSAAPPCLTNFSCKQILQDVSKRSVENLYHKKANYAEEIRIEWENGNNGPWATGYLFQNKDRGKRAIIIQSDNYSSYSNVPIFYLPDDDPTVLSLQPCCIRAYTNPNHRLAYYRSKQSKRVVVSPSCLVRLFPSTTTVQFRKLDIDSNNWIWSDNNHKNHIHGNKVAANSLSLLGELGDDVLSSDLQQEILQNHNPETIQQLTARFSMLLSRSIQIATTADASQLAKRYYKKTYMTKAIQDHCTTNQIPLLDTSSSSSIVVQPSTTNSKDSQWEPSLIIHSPNHADGKTLLAQAIAKKVGCSLIHIIRSGPLLAKYGVYADAALESMLHSWITTAAVRGKKICIIVDHLDTFMPSRLSGKSSAGDATAPVLNSIASYFSKVTGLLKEIQEWPFPIKNSLYNYAARNGQILSAQVCLIGIVTCPDDGWRSIQKNTDKGRSTIIFDSLMGGRYRLPSLTSRTRLNAFKAALDKQNITLDDASVVRLPILAASAPWAKGNMFGKVAKQLRLALQTSIKETKEATLDDLERAIQIVKKDCADFAQVTFHSSEDLRTVPIQSYFESIGGNIQAKIALGDALALDKKKQKLLKRFGLAPPTGILLYGPPGCGKTLLAKAVARLLKAPPRDQGDNNFLALGGTFISLSSSDIVRAEIGTSEKMVVSAFEFANKNAPSVIFFDEFQALFTERSSGGSGKLATTLLQCLDDVKRWREIDKSADVMNNQRVMVLAATNTPWMVDSAFLRPGRFDRVVHVGLPTIDERESILFVHMQHMKMQADESSRKSLCRNLATLTNGFSGADLAALCRASAIRALIDSATPDLVEIKEAHFLEALKLDVKRSSDDQLVKRLLTWKP